MPFRKRKKQIERASADCAEIEHLKAIHKKAREAILSSTKTKTHLEELADMTLRKLQSKELH